MRDQISFMVKFDDCLFSLKKNDLSFQALRPTQ